MIRLLYWEQTDEGLVLLTLAGETKAYEELVLRYETEVIASANGILRNRHLAEDAAQDAFVTAWIKLNMLREPSKFAPWVCRIAVNCAKHLALRYSGYSGLDAVENVLASDPGDPLRQYVFSEGQSLIREAVSALPEKVGQVIRLHYFEDLSVAEIAAQMGISVGTVKSQLHDGRKKLRKELCAMNEEMNDTLVQRVMKKVEELKLWKWKKNKDGFAEVYRDVLCEVEDLPESTDKYHALADVLHLGYWWVKGEANEKLLARIREAAEKGRNEEVLIFLVSEESENFYEEKYLEFLRDLKIPELEAGGFFRAADHFRCCLASSCFSMDEKFWEDGVAACNQVLSDASADPLYRARAERILARRKRKEEYYASLQRRNYALRFGTVELHRWHGVWRQWETSVLYDGRMMGVDSLVDAVICPSSNCDGLYTVPNLSVGQSYACSDGTLLTFEADDVRVETPCGVFESCQVWASRFVDDEYRTWFKEGVGIVKREHLQVGSRETRWLKAYSVVGGEGLLPMTQGNFWEYTAQYNSEFMVQSSRFEVTYTDAKRAVLSYGIELERKKYDENSWRDMMLQIRNEYVQWKDGKPRISDVSHAILRAEALAKTPVEKAHTKTACSAMRRIMDTDTTFNPDYTATGHWNFFNRMPVWHRGGKILGRDDQSLFWSFEWKKMGGADKWAQPLLYNNVYYILQDNTTCLFSDSWKPGVTEHVVFELYGWMPPLQTDIVCEDVGTVTVKAGTFDGCMKVTLNCEGYARGMEYLGGKKEYYFAPTVGIVKTVNYYDRNRRTAVYELTRYEGTGEGYFPVADGMTRRYDAVGLTDGYVGFAEYVYAEDERGLVIFADKGGIRKKPEVTEDFASLRWEAEEERLWKEEKFDESRMLHDANNFHLLCHFLGRWGRTYKAPARSHELYRYRMRILEAMSVTGVPDAWKGYYARICLNDAGALFAIGRKEEGYEALERALELYDAWGSIPKGTAMSVGDDEVYGGARIVKGEGMLVLADGSKQFPPHDLFDHSPAEPYNAMTAKRGWDWLRTFEQEARFKGLTEKAKALKDKYM